MVDPNFKRTVLLICEFSTEGAVGFILNRPFSGRLNDVLDDFPDFDVPLWLGGPVQTDSLHYLHNLGNQLEGSIEIFPGIYWGGDFETLRSMIALGQVDPSDIRFLLGYSGWGPGQLQDEVDEKSWISLKAKANDVLLPNDRDLWSQILQRQGGEYKVIATYPEDPQLN